ncbi:chitinase [Streptomyces sp. NPDC048340]|uniref:chitinase n=1 Tax=Streptomyces sp. NPDC048340 TaxID=3365537 RepID=UPI0037215A44
MRKRTGIALATGLATAGLMVPVSVYATDAFTNASASSGQAVNVSLTGTTWWLSGSVKIPGAQPGWKLEFEVPSGPMPQVYTGKTEISGRHVTVTGDAYQGGEFTFGVDLGGKQSSYELKNFKLNGKAVDAQGASWKDGDSGSKPPVPPTPTPPTPTPTPPTPTPTPTPDPGGLKPGESWVSDKGLKLTAEFKDWGTSGQLDFTITNTGTKDIASWSALYGLEAWLLPGDSWGDGNVSAQKEQKRLQITGKGALKAGASAKVSVATTQPGPDGRPPVDAGKPAAAWRGASPFIDAAAYPVPDLAQISKDTGVKQFVLGFIVGDSQGKGLPRWGSDAITPSQHLAKSIAELRASGGDVAVSFGGENGHELAVDHKSAQELAKTYQGVIDRYAINKIDFDVEGSIQTNAAANKRRAEAVKILQENAKRNGKQLHVSLTLPSLATGLVQDGKNVLKSFTDAGAQPDVVNVMAMMMGQSVPDMGKYGDAVISAGEGLHKQLKEFFPNKSDADLWRMVGITPNIGKNNGDGGQGVGDKGVVTVADMNKIQKFAAEKNIGMLSMWSVGRDQQCAGGAVQFDSGCSGAKQEKYDFSKAVSQYKKEWQLGK